MHIGLIGGIGPAATVVYYERIVAAFAAAKAPLDLTIGHTSALALSRNVASGKADEQAMEFKRITDQLVAAGATAVAITSMGGHFCATQFAALSPLPVISGPQAVARYLKQQGISRIGVLGTRVVMETGLYGALSELDPVVPDAQTLGQVNDDYVAIAVAGVATREQRDRLLEAGRNLITTQGAEAVLLGGTDLSLVYGDASLDFAVIDSALIHVDAIVDAALSPVIG